MVTIMKYFRWKLKQLRPQHLFLLLIAITIVGFLISCGGSENKSQEGTTGIDTLHYGEPDATTTDTTAALADSLISISATASTPVNDSAALALKARLAAETLSARISDSVKKEIREARDYMRRKLHR